MRTVSPCIGVAVVAALAMAACANPDDDTADDNPVDTGRTPPPLDDPFAGIERLDCEDAECGRRGAHVTFVLEGTVDGDQVTGRHTQYFALNGAWADAFGADSCRHIHQMTGDVVSSGCAGCAFEASLRFEYDTLASSCDANVIPLRDITVELEWDGTRASLWVLDDGRPRAALSDADDTQYNGVAFWSRQDEGCLMIGSCD